MKETGVTEVVVDFFFFLDEDQRHFSVGEELNLSIYFYLKTNWLYESKQNSNSYQK